MQNCSTKRLSGSGASGAAALVEATISGSAGAAAVRAARIPFAFFDRAERCVGAFVIVVPGPQPPTQIFTTATRGDG